MASPLRAFQWACDEHRTLPLSPQKAGSKTQNGRFSCKIALHFKKVCYKVSLYEYSQQQCCKAFTGLYIRAKMVRVRRPLLRKNFAEVDPTPSEAPIPINIRS